MFSSKRVSENLSLVNSLTIKMSSIAESMNYELEKFGVTFDVNDLTTWSYYKNISGQKHSANTDIYFTSIETNEEIELTKANLSIYQKSRAELLKYDTYFSDLAKKYSGQELYIRGVLSSIDINDAISAPDGKILYANEDFLDYNETSVLQRLSSASERFVDRWDIPQYSLIENLYAPAIYGVLINFLIVKIHLIRLENISTVEISDSYIKDTLDSYMGVGKFASSLNKASKLWLSKVIKYITFNIGKEITMDLMDKNLLRPNGISMREVNVVQSSPRDTGSTDPTVDNTVYTDNVLYTVLKNGDNKVLEPKLFSELNEESFINESLRADYAQGSYKFANTKQRLVDSDMDERTKFYVLQKSEDVNFVIHSNYKIITDSIVLMFNQLSGLIKGGTSELITSSGVSYDISNSDLFDYFLYGIGKAVGNSDDDVVDNATIGDIISWDPVSLIKHDFSIDDALANLHESTSEYRTILSAMKDALIDPNGASISDYISAQLKAQSILGSCAPRIEGPVQEAELLSIIKCITMDPFPMTIATTYGDLITGNVMDSVYAEYDINNVLDVVSSLSGSIIDKNAKSIELLNALKNVVKALTSYTVYPLVDISFSDEFANTNKIGVLEGEMITYVGDVEIRRGVVAAVIDDAIGNDERLTVDVLEQSLLYSTSDDNRSMGIFVDANKRSTIFIERPILISD